MPPDPSRCLRLAAPRQISCPVLLQPCPLLYKAIENPALVVCWDDGWTGYFLYAAIFLPPVDLWELLRGSSGVCASSKHRLLVYPCNSKHRAFHLPQNIASFQGFQSCFVKDATWEFFSALSECFTTKYFVVDIQLLYQLVWGEKVVTEYAKPPLLRHAAWWPLSSRGHVGHPTETFPYRCRSRTGSRWPCLPYTTSLSPSWLVWSFIACTNLGCAYVYCA